MTRCSICHTRIAEADATQACPDCQQSYHSTCWTELGGCATYGCKRTPEAVKPAPMVGAGAGWGDSKRCPVCNNSIGSSRLVCTCGVKFPYADPMTMAEYDEWRTEQDAVKGSKRLIVGLFLGSIIGVTAPICGLVAAAYGYAKREQLAGEHGTFLALACGSAMLGVVYSAVIATMMLGL